MIFGFFFLIVYKKICLTNKYRNFKYTCICNLIFLLFYFPSMLFHFHINKNMKRYYRKILSNYWLNRIILHRYVNKKEIKLQLNQIDECIWHTWRIVPFLFVSIQLTKKKKLFLRGRRIQMYCRIIYFNIIIQLLLFLSILSFYFTIYFRQSKNL